MSKEQADEILIQLFQRGQGCNLTLFNPNLIKEGDNDVEDLGTIGHLDSRGFNNSGSSFVDHAAMRNNKNSSKTAARSATGN